MKNNNKIIYSMIIVLVLTLSASSQQATDDDIFPDLFKNTDQCLFDSCYGIFRICNPSFPPNQMPISSLKFQFYDKNTNTKEIQNSIEILKTFEWYETVNDYITQKNCTYYPANDTTICYDQEILSGTHQEYRIEDRFVAPEVTDKIDSDTCRVIKVNGYVEIGDSVDWIPEININGIDYKQDKWAWWNSSWLKSKNQCVTTSGNDEWIQFIIGNDTEINSSTGYPMALRIVVDNVTELSYHNATDDATGHFSLWTQQNGSARTECYTIYYGNAAADYPDYSAADIPTYAVDWRGATAGGVALFDIFDSFEDNQVDGDYGWLPVGYASGALSNTTNDTEMVDGLYSMELDAELSLATKYKMGTTDTYYIAYFTYTDTATVPNAMQIYINDDPMVAAGVYMRAGYPTEDEWGRYVDAAWGSTGVTVSNSAWDKHFFAIDNTNSQYDWCINSECFTTLAFAEGTTYTNSTSFYGGGAGDPTFNIDLIIVSKNSFNASSTRPVMGTRTAEDSDNTAPTITNITLSPISPYTDENITWNVTCQDNENDTLQIEYNVYNGTTLTFYGNITGVANATSTEIFQLSPSNTTVGEMWNFTARCWDSTSWSVYNSSNVTIIAPLFTDWNITPSLNSTYRGNAWVRVNVSNASVEGVKFWYAINTTSHVLLDTSPIFVNGSLPYPFWRNKSMTLEIGTRYNVSIHADDYEPQTANYDLELMHDVGKSNLLVYRFHPAKVKFQNCSTLNYSAFTIMFFANISLTTTDNLDVTYYNSSNSSASIGAISIIDPFDHVHSVNSSHHITTFSSNASGHIGNVKTTGTCYIGFSSTQESSSKGWRLKYAAVPNTDTLVTSANSGATWNAVSGTADAALIQRTNITYFTYLAESRGTNSTVQESLITESQLPPTSPVIEIPLNNVTYSGIINVSWSLSNDPNGNDFNYTGYLTDGDGIIQQVVFHNLTKNVINHTFDSATVSDGGYRINITACDIYGCGYYWMGTNFTIQTFYFPTLSDLTIPTLPGDDVPLNITFNVSNRDGGTLCLANVTWFRDSVEDDSLYELVTCACNETCTAGIPASILWLGEDISVNVTPTEIGGGGGNSSIGSAEVRIIVNTDRTMTPGTYNCTGDSSGCVIINASDVTLNCEEAIIDGGGNQVGGKATGFDGSTIANCIFRDYQYGIYLPSNSDNFNFINTTIRGTNTYGIYIEGGSKAANFTNVNITGAAIHALYLEGVDNSHGKDLGLSGNGDALYFQTVSGGEFSNVYMDSVDNGIYFAASENIIIKNSSIVDATGSAVFYYESDAGKGGNNIIIDSNISSTDGNTDIKIQNNIPNTNHFLNVTFNKSKILFDALAEPMLNVSYYLYVNVKDSGAVNIQYANVNISDKNGGLIINSPFLTDASGNIIRQNVTSYTINRSTTTELSNYTIFTNKTNYISDTQSTNLTTNKQINVVLNSVPTTTTTTTTLWTIGNRTGSMNDMLSGDLIPAVLLSFTGVMGAWFFLLVYFIFIVLAYLKTQTVVFPALVGLVFGGVGMMYLPQESMSIAYIMLFLSIATIIYRAVKGAD